MEIKISFISFLIATGTAMIGYDIHHSIFWSIVDFMLFPFAIVKWLILHQVNLTIIKDTFGFLFK